MLIKFFELKKSFESFKYKLDFDGNEFVLYDKSNDLVMSSKDLDYFYCFYKGYERRSTENFFKEV